MLHKIFLFFPDVNLCKRRWRSLRDVFTKQYRQMKSQASGSAGDKKKPWTFYSNMEFLIPYIEFKETTGNYACQSPVQSQEVSELQTEQLQEMLEPAAEVPEDVPVQPRSSRNQQDRDITEASAMRKRKRSKPMTSECTEAKILQVLSEKYDPDEHFLLSLLPSLKRLNPKKNAEALLRRFYYFIFFIISNFFVFAYIILLIILRFCNCKSVLFC